jgi:hypothetical protein
MTRPLRYVLHRVSSPVWIPGRRWVLRGWVLRRAAAAASGRRPR